jgi:hypothetical protein
MCAVLLSATAATAALLCFTRPRRTAPGNTDDVQNALRQIRSDLKIQRRAIYDSRGVINDAHKHILAVSKGLAKQPC